MSYRCFHVTTIGDTHINHGTACEDASGSWSLEERGAYAIVVADGHGDPYCTRSGMGSRLAVGVTLQVFSELARKDAPPSDRLELTGQLMSRWERAVRRHAQTHPLEAEEQAILDDAAKPRRLYQLYGTTLVAALVTPAYCLLLQQGDGCCVVLDDQGAYHRPVPDDERCVGNKTSSLSDADAAERMRAVLLNVTKKPIAAVLTATDGVDKSLSGDAGLFDFCDWVLLSTMSSSADDVGRWLEEQFAALRGQGVGDDLSLAVVERHPLSQAFVAKATKRREIHALQSERDEAQAKIVSMGRKHRHLEELCRAGDRAAAKEYAAYHALYIELQQRVAQLERQLAEVDSNESDSSRGTEAQARYAPKHAHRAPDSFSHLGESRTAGESA